MERLFKEFTKMGKDTVLAISKMTSFIMKEYLSLTFPNSPKEQLFIMIKIIKLLKNNIKIY